MKKIIKKKKQLANAFKQKSKMDKQNSKTVVINIFSNLGKKELLTSILAPTLEKHGKIIRIIGVDAYCLVC